MTATTIENYETGKAPIFNFSETNSFIYFTLKNNTNFFPMRYNQVSRYITIMALNADWDEKTTVYFPKYTPIPFYECTEKDFSFDEKALEKFRMYRLSEKASGYYCLDTKTA